MPYTRRDFIIDSSLLFGSAAVDLSSISKLDRIKSLEGNSLVLLGTQGGPFLRSYKQTPSANLIIYNKMPYVIDTGYGVSLKLLDAGLTLSALKYIFITHHHSDHNLELGPLLYNSWLSGLNANVQVYAPKGLKQVLHSYFESNSFDLVTRIADEGRPDLRKLITPYEFSAGTIFSNEDVTVSAIKNIHPPVKESYAFKFKLGDKLVVFSGDTAYCPALIGFAADADYLVHEVMYKSAIETLVQHRPNASRLKESILSHHTPAEDVGMIATKAKVKNLVLNHFVPSDEKLVTNEMWIDAVRKNFAGNIIIGKDLLQLPL